MGRHSQNSSVQTTFVELGALAVRTVSGGKQHGRRRAAGPARSSVAPVMVRAGGAAATLALAVSGAAYAAVGASGEDVKPLKSRTQLQAIGGATGTASATASASSEGLTVGGQETTVETVTEEAQDPYTSTEEQTASLPAGERQVKTAGVNGVTRTTYQVTKVGGQEVSRETVSTVVVSQRVDEVVLVGTGTGYDATSAQAIAKSMMASYGWGDDQFSCLVKLWNKESHWNYQAQNASSGAYGIPQALPGSKMSSVASDWATNPATQITWGLKYIAGRYGNPCTAWAHSGATGWY